MVISYRIFPNFLGKSELIKHEATRKELSIKLLKTGLMYQRAGGVHERLLRFLLVLVFEQ